MIFLSITGEKLKKFFMKKYAFIEPELRKDRQTWSHFKIKLTNWTLTIPDHKEIKEWLFNDILVQCSKLIGKSKEEIFKDLKNW